MQGNGGQNHLDGDPNLKSLSSPLKGQTGNSVSLNTSPWTGELEIEPENFFTFVLQSDFINQDIFIPF